MNRRRAWTGGLVGVVLLVAIANGQAKSGSGIPLLEGFVVVKAGDRAQPATEPPPPHPPSITVDAREYSKGDVVTLDIKGSISAAKSQGRRQLLIFRERGERAPVSITAVLPFDAAAWIGDASDASLRYDAVSAVSGNRRELLLVLDGHRSLRYVQLYGNTPVGTELEGLTVRQAEAKERSEKPSSGFSYPVPVTVEDSEGRITRLWQGQGTILTGEGGDTGVFVLVSEVAKPRGPALYLNEGSSYDFQVLVFGSD